MKITSDENVNQAVEQMVQAIRNTDAYLEYQKQLARVKEQPELKRQIDEFRTRNFELQTSKDTNFDKLDQRKRSFPGESTGVGFSGGGAGILPYDAGDRTLRYRSDAL